MLTTRPPIVVILGHVDHGKTSLLDNIRSTSVAAREAGGITQHIGAYQVTTPQGFAVTFIDTPGHAAFSQMRSRGGQVADIAILVVSSVDGVMPQTKEAIEIIKSANLPTIVAATKIDLPDVSLDRLKTQLSENNLIPEDYGGDVPIVSVSAKTGQGIPELLEMIKLVNELHPTQADPEGEFKALVIESKLDKHKGPLATLLIQNGTLKSGSEIQLGGVKCKVKSITSSTGNSLASAPPSIPVEVLGFASVPPVGSHSALPGDPAPATSRKASDKDLKIILKSDVGGSLEALLKSLPSNHLHIINSAVGDVTETEVLSAANLGASIIAFNVRVPASVAKLAEIEHVRVSTHRIIYELITDVEDQIAHILNPYLGEQTLGQATILASFEIDSDKIAGCRVDIGRLAVGDRVHLKRQDTFVADSKVRSIKRGKDASQEAKLGEQFGLVLSPAIDFKVNDVLISFSKSL